jgi:3-dehydroquinate synthase
MLMAAELSALEGFIASSDVQQVKDLLQKAQLPVSINSKISYQDFVDAMSVDKKVIDGEVHLVLMKKLGQTFISKDYQKNDRPAAHRY